jgi:nitroimidazol reductase NimA-like FMN-containing flavoprotein (pyridoxamine 5'-phosphate oxidase superfamily)
MATTNQHQQAGLGTAGQEVPHPAAGDDARPIAARLTNEQVWQQLAKASFAVLGYVTPAGEPRSSGVVYKSIGRRLYVAVASDSWKARHIAATRRVAVTVPVRRGGLLSLVAPIPPATVSFHGTAIVHPADSPQVHLLLKELASLLPEERQASACILEVIPEGCFVTYGVGVSLTQMRDPAAARARVPVTQEKSAR